MRAAARLSSAPLSFHVREMHIFAGAVLIILAYLVLIPLILLILSGFKETGFLFDPGFTLEHFIRIYTDRQTWELIQYTLIFATGSTSISLGLGILFAWLTERTNLPLRSVVRVALVLPIAIPGVLLAMGWVLLASPRIGMMNHYLMEILDLKSPPFNIFSLPGMIFAQGLSLTPTAFLIVSPSFKRMDPLLEEAASIAGANLLKTLRYVVFPLLLPGIFAAAAYVFLVTLVVFDIPGTLGIPARIFVFSSEIYWSARPTMGLPEYGRIGALSTVFLFTTLVLAFFYNHMTRRAGQFTTVTGKGYRPKLIDLGKWKYLWLAAILLYLTLALVLPFLSLLWTSLIPYFQPFSVEKLRLISFASYSSTLGFPKVRLALTNTLVVVAVSSTVVAVFSTLISWLIAHSESYTRRALDFLSFLPMSIPHLMLGLALIYVYLTVPFLPVYGTVWILVIAFVTTYLAFGTRTTNAAMFQLHKELEEAAQVSGASRLRTFRSIVIPLILPALLNVFIWVAAHSMRELSAALMLRTSRSVVISTVIWGFWAEDSEMNRAAALGVIMIVILLILTVIGFFVVESGQTLRIFRRKRLNR